MNTAQEIKRRNRLEVSKRRAAEERDAMHFLMAGHDAHLEKGCIHDEPCSRDYDPRPVSEAAPADERMYVGTGIGALYGLGGEEHLWTLAGWNVKRDARRRETGRAGLVLAGLFKGDDGSEWECEEATQS